MSGSNNMRYKYDRICFSMCMHSLWHFGCMLCNRLLGDATVHETKWTSHVKRRNDSAHIYILDPVTQLIEIIVLAKYMFVLVCRMYHSLMPAITHVQLRTAWVRRRLLADLLSDVSGQIDHPNIYVHISATTQQIITKFSAVATYVKRRQSWKFQFICIWVTMLTMYIIFQYCVTSQSKNKNKFCLIYLCICW